LPKLFDPDKTFDATSILANNGPRTSLLTLAEQIAGSLPQHPPSPASLRSSAVYDATIRRENIQKMIKHFDSMDRQSAREDFAVCVFPLVDSLRQTLARLADSLHEGNTREILRRVRDTLLDGAWLQYREPSARVALAAVLRHLSRAESVISEDVQRFAGEMRTAGIKTAEMPMLDFDEESDGIDGKDEIEAAEVSD
jgi:hypothetical protein